MTLRILSMPIEHEQDVVLARRRARQVAELLQFDAQDQARIGAAVSEIARNGYSHGGGARAEFLLEREAAGAALIVKISDRGPGISNLDGILNSPRPLAVGIGAARRLMDSVDIQTRHGGTTVTLRKKRSGTSDVSARMIADFTSRIASEPQSIIEEVRTQNRDLLHALEDVRNSKAALEQRQEELIRLNRELEETNRGVVALYAELDERVERLRTADIMKSRFLSYMSHEFRTPLNGIIGLARLLLNRSSVCGDEEAAKQVRFMQTAAEELTELVNNLLDLAKAEAGKLRVRAVPFEVDAVFGTLRGLLRPLPSAEQVVLVFEDAGGLPPLLTDETKLAQILRNLVSNALKFTERGEVHVSAAHDPVRDSMIFTVSDTGIGIPAELQSYVFEEFSQIEHPLQKKAKGTGLGLPLCKRLSALLGGTIAVESTVGRGSRFTVTIPRVFREHRTGQRRVLIIDDDEVSRYLLKELMPDSVETSEASGGDRGVELAREIRPDLIVLDLKMPGMSGPEVLRELRAHPATREIAVVIATSYPLGEDERRVFDNQVSAILAKDKLARSQALDIDFGPPVMVKLRPRSQVEV